VKHRVGDALDGGPVPAGGSHNDCDEYDRAAAGQRRTAVRLDPERAYSN
jgi:hypothetical protein